MKPSISTLSALTLSALLCIACSGQKNVPTPPAPQVGYMLPVAKQVTDSIQLDGVVAPSESVNLVARVSGYLQSAPFKEGDQVKKNQLLFVIEPEPYRQQVKLNQAKVVQAHAEEVRQQTLLKENATAQSSVETAVSDLQQAQANLSLAQINLGYTSVKAPFDGMIGRRLIDAGNYVGASPGGTVLATLMQLRPVYVYFSINERDLLRIRAAAAAQNGQEYKPGVGKTPVGVALQGETLPSEQGVLDFIGNGLSTDTGSLQLRASFPNRDLRLLPGLYGKVFINVGKPRHALLLPRTVILSDQVGNYVYVVGGDSKVIRRNVTTGATFGHAQEVLTGLSASDHVITEGISNVGLGQKVDAHLDSNPDGV
jgi:membrane fusion protein, multidrug efflux system